MNLLPLYILSCKNVTSSFFFLAWEEARTEVFLGPYRDAERSHHLILSIGCEGLLFSLLLCNIKLLPIHHVSACHNREHQHNLLGFYDTNLMGRKKVAELIE